MLPTEGSTRQGSGRVGVSTIPFIPVLLSSAPWCVCAGSGHLYLAEAPLPFTERSCGCAVGPGATFFGFSTNTVCLCCSENNRALCCSCARLKASHTLWRCLEFWGYCQGSGQWLRKTSRKCGNRLGPGDRSYRALAGCSGLSKTEALKWPQVLPVVGFAPSECSQFRDQFGAATTTAVAEQEWATAVHCPLENMQPLLSTGIPIRNLPLVPSTGRNFVWKQSLWRLWSPPALYHGPWEAEPACVCYWAKCPTKSPLPWQRESVTHDTILSN